MLRKGDMVAWGTDVNVGIVLEDASPPYRLVWVYWFDNHEAATTEARFLKVLSGKGQNDA